MTSLSNLMHDYVKAQATIVLFVVVAILALCSFKRKECRPKVAMYISIIFLLPWCFNILMGKYGSINTGTALCWTMQFVIGQLPAVAFGFALYCIRRSSGALRVIGSVVATLSLIDLGIIMFKAITRNN